MITIEAINKYIHENQIEQKKLAKKTNIGEVQLSLILNRKRKLIADEYLKICDALCVPYDRFVNCAK